MEIAARSTNISRSLRVVGTLAILAGLSACANLESVRDFSKQSANLTSTSQAIDYWASWNERSSRFDAIVTKLPLISGKAAKGPTSPISAPAKEQVDAIKSLQAVLSAYMTKLGALAEDDVVDVSKQVDGLVTNLNKLPTDDVEKQKRANSAYGTVIKLVKLPLDAYRHYKIKELIIENNENIQALTTGLSTAMGSISKFSVAERENVLAWYDVTSGDYPAPSNFASALQWEKDRKSIAESYESKAGAIASYQKSLATIGKLHDDMAKKLSSFNTQEFKILVSSLQDAKDEIVAARKQYNEAFK